MWPMLSTLTHFFLYFPLFCWKKGGVIRPQITVQFYILQDYSNVRIGFNMINKCL